MILNIEDHFDLEKIMISGQCFRVSKDAGDANEAPAYRFVTGSHVVYIREITEPGACEKSFDVSCSKKEWDEIWHPYFDMDTDYRSIFNACYGKHPFADKAMIAGEGLRILRQDPWEMLISFIISQRKSIPAIRTSIEAICDRFGAYAETTDSTAAGTHLFPTADELACVSFDDLKACGLGYRVPYVLDAARRVAHGELDLDALAEADDETLLTELMKVKGVGKKVSNCIALFAYGRLNLVPVDVWIDRAIEIDCKGKSPFPLYGENAGIIQQYIFYYKVSYTGSEPYQRYPRQRDEARR